MSNTSSAGADWLRDELDRMDSRSQFVFTPEPEPADEQTMTDIANYLNNRFN